MNIDVFFSWVNSAGSFFGVPLLFWGAYFFLCHFLNYPSELEKHIRNGKVWPYLPIFWKNKKRKLIKIASLFVFWAGNIFSACALYYLFPFKHFVLLIIGGGLSIFIEIKINYYAVKDIIRLQQDRYFQIYTHLANQALSKGDEISDGELLSRTQWQHQNDLRIADKQGRLLPFLRGEAKL